jgi:hypothetical protein
MSGSNDGNVNVNITASDDGYAATIKAANELLAQWVVAIEQVNSTAEQFTVITKAQQDKLDQLNDAVKRNSAEYINLQAAAAQAAGAYTALITPLEFLTVQTKAQAAAAASYNQGLKEGVIGYAAAVEAAQRMESAYSSLIAPLEYMTVLTKEQQKAQDSLTQGIAQTIIVVDSASRSTNTMAEAYSALAAPMNYFTVATKDQMAAQNSLAQGIKENNAEYIAAQAALNKMRDAYSSIAAPMDYFTVQTKEQKAAQDALNQSIRESSADYTAAQAAMKKMGDAYSALVPPVSHFSVLTKEQMHAQTELTRAVSENSSEYVKAEAALKKMEGAYSSLITPVEYHTVQTRAQKVAQDQMTESAVKSTRELNNMSGATSSITRELVVIGHEAMTGRFSRIPGSLLVLTEYMGKAGIATMGLVGAFALAALGAAELIGWINRLNAARAEATAAGAFFNPQIPEKVLDGMVEQFRKLSGVTTTEAGSVVATFARMKGANETTVQALIDQTRRYAAATGEKLPQAAESIKSAFESPTESGQHFLNMIGASTEAIKKFQSIDGEGAVAQRRVLMLTELDAATARVGKTAQQSKIELGDALSGGSGVFGDVFMGGMPDAGELVKHLENVERTKMEKIAKVRREALINMSDIEKTADKQQTTWFQRQVEGADELRTSVAAGSDDIKTVRLQQATQLAEYWHTAQGLAEKGTRDEQKAHEQYLHWKEQADIQNLHIEGKGNPTWFQNQMEGADELKAHVAAASNDYKKVFQQQNEQLRDYWQRAAQEAKKGSRDQQQAHELYLRYAAAADISALKTSGANEHAALQAQLASLTAKQKANKENEELVMQLEDEKLALLKARYREDSKEYQTELGHKAELEREFVNRATRIGAENIKQHEKQDLAIFQSAIKRMNAQVAAHAISNDQAIESLKKMASEIASTEDAMYVDLLKHLGKGTEAYEKAMGLRATAAARAAKIQVTLSAQTEIEESKAADRNLQAYNRMFNNISNVGEQTLSGLVLRTMTWQQAERKVAQAILGDFINMSVHMVARWATQELIKGQISTAANAARKAQELGGSGLMEYISRTLAGWLGMETTKTGITVGQTTIREGIVIDAAAVGAAATAAKNAGEVTSNAAVGAAAAGASVAAIPVTGWEMAPEVAATTFATLSAYSAPAMLATGTMNVPQDMAAIIHKGEAVIPETFADGMRKNGFQGMMGQNKQGDTQQMPDVHLHMTIQAIDTQTGMAFINSQLPHIATRLKRHMAVNPTVR